MVLAAYAAAALLITCIVLLMARERAGEELQ
jgi:hypothetical protein